MVAGTDLRFANERPKKSEQKIPVHSISVWTLWWIAAIDTSQPISYSINRTPQPDLNQQPIRRLVKF